MNGDAGGVVDPNASPGSAGSAFTGDPSAPGAELRPLTPQGLLAPVPALAPALSGVAAPAGRLLGGMPAMSAANPIGPQASSAGGSQIAPLFNVADLQQQYQIFARMPGAAPQAAAILGLIQKGVPEGAYMGVDGSIQTRPGMNGYTAGQAQAKAYGEAAGAYPFAGPTAAAKARGEYPAKLALEVNTPRIMRGEGTTLTDGNGRVLAQIPMGINGVDASGAPYRDWRNFSVAPSAANGGGTQPTPMGLPGGSAPPAAPPAIIRNMSVGGGGGLLSPGQMASAVPASAPGTPPVSGGAGSGVNAQGLPRVQTGLSPLQESSAQKRGSQLEEYGAGLATNATNAVNQQFLVDQMKNESGNGAGWQPGRFAEWGGELKALFNGVLPNASDSINAALANYQSFQKNAMQLTTAATRAVSPRAAVQEMQMIRTAMPGAETSQGGLNYIFNQLSANNDFQRAKAQAADVWRPQRGGTLDGFESAWNKNVSPFAFLAHRMSAGDLQSMAANLQGTAQGRALLTKMMGEVQYAQKNNLFQDGAQ